jgi:malonyl-CoA/methylmalonyl-CoA synthetase
MAMLMERILARPATKTCVIDERGPTAFGPLVGHAMHLAEVLRAGRHTLAGARVAILAQQDADWVATLLGIWLAGGVAVPLSPAYPSAELAWFGADADVDAVVLSPEHGPLAAALSAGRRCLTSDAGRAAAASPHRAPRTLAPAPLGETDIAVILYTSGTTGRPKGAPLGFDHLGACADRLRDAWGLGADDVLLHTLPLHHLHGLSIALLATLASGGAVHMLRRFDAAAVVAALGSGAATTFMAVPTMYMKLREHVGGDAKALAARIRRPRLCTSGSAALPVTLAGFWADATGEIPLERFGMTEIGVGASNPLAPAARRAGSVGLPLPAVELRLVDESGHDLDRGPAELWVRGPQVFRGYWRRDEATAAAFAPGGWFKTGDVAERSADGFVRLLGRTSQDILKSGGYKLSALEIEEALREHPDVAEVAVVGLPDETWGERVVAALVLRPGASPSATSAAALSAFARDRLASYKAPREFVVVGELPKNAMGKVMKAELRRELAGRVTPA